MPKSKHAVPEEFREKIAVQNSPWGNFTSYPREEVASIKIITVDPGGILSLQYHNNRDEFWVILDDGLEVTVGENTWRTTAGEELWITRGVKHRVKCVADSPARFFELWIGESSESDIVRIEDEYGRK